MCDGTKDYFGQVWVALESEWSKNFDAIKYDFCKLIHGRSMLRVMVFQSRDVKNTIGELVKTLVESRCPLLETAIYLRAA